MPQQEESALPSSIAVRLPAVTLLRDALLDNIIELPPGHRLIRGAWNPASVWPEQVTRTYRFGPPDALRGPAGRYPFHWLYAAGHVITAAWEAQFCANDTTRPGTFYIRPGADNALVATLTFGQPIRLLDLTGTAASKLGIYDDLRSPDYEWSQWFGCRMDEVIAAQRGALHGFRYPSRRHPGFNAYAISSRTMAMLEGSMSRSTDRFGNTEQFTFLTHDVCCVSAP